MDAGDPLRHGRTSTINAAPPAFGFPKRCAHDPLGGASNACTGDDGVREYCSVRSSHTRAAATSAWRALGFPVPLMRLG